MSDERNASISNSALEEEPSSIQQPPPLELPVHASHAEADKNAAGMALSASQVSIDSMAHESTDTPTNAAAGSPSASATFAVGRYKQSFCPICLERYTVENPAILYRPCCHAFHFQCAETWLMRSNLCPVCNNPISSTTGQLMTASDVKVRKTKPTKGGRRESDMSAASSSSASSPTLPKQVSFRDHPQPGHAEDDETEDDTPLLQRKQPKRPPATRTPVDADASARERVEPDDANTPGEASCAESTEGSACEQEAAGSPPPESEPRGSGVNAVDRSRGERMRRKARLVLAKFGSWCAW